MPPGLRRAMAKHPGREDAAGRVCRDCGRKGRTASRARALFLLRIPDAMGPKVGLRRVKVTAAAPAGASHGSRIDIWYIFIGRFGLLGLSTSSDAVLPLSRIAGRMPLFALTETVMASLPAPGATVLP